MKICQLKSFPIQIPLQLKFSQANKATRFSDSVIVELKNEEGVSGYGESCPRPYVTGETTKSVLADLARIKDQLLTVDFSDLAIIREFLEKEIAPLIGPASLCALELAILDLWSKSYQVNLLGALGGRIAENKKYSGVIPLMSLKQLPNFIKRLNTFDFPSLKLKIDQRLDANIAKIKRIREQYHSDVPIRVDANCSWTLAEARVQIPIYWKHGIASFEQIFPKGREADLAIITQEFGEEVRIMADESLTTFDSAMALIEKGQGNSFNLKLSKNGGIFSALNIYQLACENNWHCQLGAHFGETSILSAAGVIFGKIATGIDDREGALGEHLLEKDICSPCWQVGKEARVERGLKGFGLGVEVDWGEVVKVKN